jgi:hypothetical protein
MIRRQANLSGRGNSGLCEPKPTSGASKVNGGSANINREENTKLEILCN